MKKQVKTNYKIGGIVLLTALLTLAFPTACHASLQSRPGATSLVDTTASDFFKMCREMETSSGSLGLSATIEVQDDKVVETSPSNGIDVHMIKNTEYGTVAMLAASAYGNCQSSDNNSTTPNASGIMQMNSHTYVAGIYTSASKTSSYTKYIATADAKYKNVYNSSSMSNTSYISGDATYETYGWYGSSDSEWVSSSYPVFARRYFRFKGTYGDEEGIFYRTSNMWKYTDPTHRATVVCGDGF